MLEEKQVKCVAEVKAAPEPGAFCSHPTRSLNLAAAAASV